MPSKLCARYCRQVLLASLILAAVGCSDGTEYDVAPVSGKVTKNGQPAPGVVVSFEPIGGGEKLNPGPSSAAITGSDGSYTLILHREDEQQGAVVGEHRVRLWTEMKSSDDQNNWQEQIPAQYNEETKQKFTVPSEGSSEANFDIRM